MFILRLCFFIDLVLVVFNVVMFFITGNMFSLAIACFCGWAASVSYESWKNNENSN